MKNVIFPARVNLLMEFSVIGIFVLIIEKRFFSSLDSPNLTSTKEQLVRHLSSLVKLLSVSICKAGKLLLCVSGMF